MNNLLLFVAALLVMALSALFAAPYFVDWNDYRSVFEEQASRLVGRDVNVGGDVSLTFLPAPVMSFENVNIADEEGKFDTPFLSAKSFSVWLAVPPLLRGVIEAREVELDSPVLNLQAAPDGTGNWGDVGRADARLPFVPRDVALDSLQIVDATVMLAQGTGEPYLTLDQLNGELSARSLRGPYKFAGRFEADGKTRSVRFSTGRRDADESIKLKAVIGDEDGGSEYQFDGALTGFGTVPRFAGSFAAQVTAGQADTTEDGPPAAEGQAVPVKMKAQLEAGLESAAFSDVEITILRSDKPQTITGQLALGFGMQKSLRAELASKWVDLDLLSGSEVRGADGPGAVVAHAARALLGFASPFKQVQLSLALDQAVVGGDLLGNVRGEFMGSGDAISVKGFNALLPGDATLSLEGTIAGDQSGPSFNGAAEVSGEKLNRLLGWVGLQQTTITASQEGTFSLRGKVVAEPARFGVDAVTGELFGSRFSGAVSYSGAERKQFDLTLRSDRLDIAKLGGDANVSIPALLRGLIPAPATGEQPQPDGARETPFDWLGDAEARIDVDVGSVNLPDVGESALTAGLHIVDGNIEIRKLRLRAEKDLDVEAKGQLTGLKDTPKGRIALDLNAASAPGLHVLGQLLDLETQFGIGEGQLALFAPAQMSVSIESADGGKTGLAGKLDGTLGGSQVQLAADLGGALANWRTAPLEISLKITNDNGQKLLRQVLSGATERVGLQAAAEPGSVSLLAKGDTADALQGVLVLKTGGLNWSTDGTASLGEGRIGFRGRSQLSASNGLALLQLAGIRTAPGRSGERVRLASDVTIADRVFELKGIRGSIGPEMVDGSVRLDRSSERPRIELDLKSSGASLPLLLEPLIAWDGPQRPGVVRGVTRTETFWPDETIDAAVLGSFDGRFRIEAERLRLAGPLVLSGAQLDATVSKGELVLDKVKGGIFGGEFEMQAWLASQASGLVLEGKGRARGLLLEQIVTGAGKRPSAKGRANIELAVNGSGLTPRGLASGLNGSGTLSLGGGLIRGLGPQAPKDVATDLRRPDYEGKMEESEVGAAVGRKMAADRFDYQAFETPIELKNGVLRMEGVSLKDPDGQASVTSFLELATLKLDSEWVLMSKTGEDADEAPRVTLVFAGPLAELGRLKPSIDTQALQRYVTIRRMQQDVERLEKLEVPGAKKKVPDGEADRQVRAPESAAVPVAPAAPPAPARAPLPTPKPAPPVVERQPAPVVVAPAVSAPPAARPVRPDPVPPRSPQGLPWHGAAPPPAGPAPTVQNPPPPQAPPTAAARPPVTAAPNVAVPAPAPAAPAPQPRKRWNPFEQDGS